MNIKQVVFIYIFMGINLIVFMTVVSLLKGNIFSDALSLALMSFLYANIIWAILIVIILLGHAIYDKLEDKDI